MKAIIKPSRIGGTIAAPPSKSYTHRAIILASLAHGDSIIRNPLISDDTKATINACQLLGVNISMKNGDILIKGVDGHFPEVSTPIKINCGLSGTTIRLMTAVASVSPNKVTLAGEKRLLERPLGDLITALRQLGVDIETTKNGFPPIKIAGGILQSGRITIPGDTSSQFVSALLLIAPFSKQDMIIEVDNLQSAPYVDITIDMMKTFGVQVQRKGNTFKVKRGQKYGARRYTVEGDFSSASYFIALEAISRSKIAITGLTSHSVQGDKYFLEVLKKVKNHENNLDLGNYPDIVPTVSIVTATMNRPTKISNIGHLRKKESDRIAAIESELQKMAVRVESTKDSITIHGGKLKGAEIDTHNDHRIAMSFAIAGLVAQGKTTINNAEVVNKSYPNFWKDLKNIRAEVEII